MAKTINPPTKWTEEELSVLSNKYYDLGAIGILSLLPRRTLSGIKYKSQRLNLTCSKEARYVHNFNDLDVSKFIDKKTPESVYILGLLWADGHVCKIKPRRGRWVDLKLVSTDFEVIKPILSATADWKFYDIKARRGYKPQNSGRLSDPKLHKFLCDHDYLIKSSVSPTKILSTIHDNLTHYFWRGFFDGDGNIDSKKDAVTLTGSLNQDWIDYENLLKKLDISYSIYKAESKSGNSSSVRFYSRRKISNFSDYIYQGEWFGLDRKRQKFLEVKNKFELDFYGRNS